VLGRENQGWPPPRLLVPSLRSEIEPDEIAPAGCRDWLHQTSLPTDAPQRSPVGRLAGGIFASSDFRPNLLTRRIGVSTMRPASTCKSTSEPGARWVSRATGAGILTPRLFPQS